jgi:hypothetical protein
MQGSVLHAQGNLRNAGAKIHDNLWPAMIMIIHRWSFFRDNIVEAQVHSSGIVI